MDQIVLGVLSVIGFMVFMLVIAVLSKNRPAPSEPEAPREDRTGWTCAICCGPYPGKVDQFGQHDCPGFGRLTCCGYQVETASGADAFAHLCAPTEARKQLAIEREMDKLHRAEREGA